MRQNGNAPGGRMLYQGNNVFSAALCSSAHCNGCQACKELVSTGMLCRSASLSLLSKKGKLMNVFMVWHAHLQFLETACQVFFGCANNLAEIRWNYVYKKQIWDTVEDTPMQTQTVREKITEVILSLPEDASYDDIMRELALERRLSLSLIGQTHRCYWYLQGYGWIFSSTGVTEPFWFPAVCPAVCLIVQYWSHTAWPSPLLLSVFPARMSWLTLPATSLSSR